VQTRRRCFSLAAIGIVALPPVYAATFVVPPDRLLVERATAIVVASPVATRTELHNDSIETITTMSIENVLKGASHTENVEVYEPGGVYEDRATMIPGVPRFRDGERYILFLTRSDGRWHVLDLVLGKFRFDTDTLGRQVVVRDENEIVGWDPDGTPHREQNRDAARFLAFIRTTARGGPVRQNYFVPAEPLVTIFAATSLRAIPNAAFTANSYTFTISGSLGGRWNVFPSAVNYFSVGTEPGAPGGGVTAINTAFAAWNGDPSSNVNYVYAGADNSGTHNGGVGASDGQNTIAFERDLSAFGAAPFTCTSNSYSGTLGLGGITNASGTHTHPNGETFSTAHEGDVEMNRGIANCALLFNNGDFDSAVTHEVGHTLGFRHSDQTRADNPSIPCTNDATLECSNNAIMKSFVSQGLRATLQAWDQHAVAAVYPGSGGGGTVPPAPTGVVATAVSSTQVNVSWNVVSGATSYQVFRRGPGGSFVQVGTSTTTSFSDTSAAPNTSYLYRVRAVNSVGASTDSAGDIATTVIFTDDPLVPGSTVIKAEHLTQLRTAVNAVRALAGLTAATFTDPTPNGVVVKAIHIEELRRVLDPATSPLGLSSGGWSDPSLAGVVIKAIHFQEIRNRVR
jgi:hypothetical protein